MISLPQEIQDIILSFTDVTSIMILRRVSKKYKKRISMPANIDTSVKFIEWSIIDGHLSVLKYLIRDTFPSYDIVKLSVRYNRINILFYLLEEEKFNIWKELGEIAAEEGHLEMLKYLVKNRLPYNNLSVFAAKSGNLEMIKYTLLELKCEYNKEVLTVVVDGGHLEILKYLYQREYINGIVWLLPFEISEKNIPCLKFLIESYTQIYDLDESYMDAVVESGQLEYLKYLHERGIDWDDRVTTTAVENRNVEMLKYAHENGCPIDEDIFNNDDYAYSTTSLECIKYLHDIGIKCEWACNEAAENGDIELLTFAHENGYKWNYEVTHKCIIRDDDICLNYAIKNGCPYKWINGDIYDTVMYLDAIKCLVCLIENKIPFDRDKLLNSTFGNTCHDYLVDKMY